MNINAYVIITGIGIFILYCCMVFGIIIDKLTGNLFAWDVSPGFVLEDLNGLLVALVPGVNCHIWRDEVAVVVLFILNQTFIQESVVGVVGSGGS